MICAVADTAAYLVELPVTAVIVRWPVMVRPSLVPFLHPLSMSAVLGPPILTVQPETTSIDSVIAPQ